MPLCGPPLIPPELNTVDTSINEPLAAGPRAARRVRSGGGPPRVAAGPTCPRPSFGRGPFVLVTPGLHTAGHRPRTVRRRGAAARTERRKTEPRMTKVFAVAVVVLVL